MAAYRHHLPQLDGGVFLTDAGLETDLIFNHGIEMPEFAAHTLLTDEHGRTALAIHGRIPHTRSRLRGRFRAGYPDVARAAALRCGAQLGSPDPGDPLQRLSDEPCRTRRVRSLG